MTVQQIDLEFTLNRPDHGFDLLKLSSITQRIESRGRVNIKTLKMKYEEQLMRLPNVMGVSIGRKAGKDVMKVFVTHKVSKSSLRPEDVIPEALEGFEVDVEELGDVTTQS